MKILQLSIISALVFGFNAVVFGQQYAAPQTISLSPGQTKTVEGNGRRNSPKTYQVKVSSRTDITVTLKNISGQVTYDLTTEGMGDGTVPIENYGTHQVIQKTSPLTTVYKGGEKDFFIEVKPTNSTANFHLTVSARPIKYKNYTIKTCTGTVPVRIGSFDGVEPNYVDDDLGFVDSKPNVSVITGAAVFGDLNGDGRKEVIFSSICNYIYERKKDFETYHVFDLSTDSTSELTQLKDEELFQLNKRETDDYNWDATNFKINNQKFERKLERSYSVGDDIRPTNQTKKGSFVLKNNRLVAADNLPTRPTTSAKNVRTLNEYSFDSCGEQNPVILKASTFTDLKSKAVHKNGAKINDEGLVSLSVGDALLGDLTGDGVDEGLAMITCNWGGTGDFSFLVAFNLDAVQPVKIAELDEQFSNEGYRTEKGVIQNQQIVVTYVHQPGKAYPKGAQKTQAYVIKNGRFVRNTIRNNKAVSNSQPKSETVSEISDTPQNQTIEKADFTLEVPGGWATALERDNAVSLALPQNIKQINNQPDISFGVAAGVTDIKLNTAKSILNDVLGKPVVNAKGLDDAGKRFVKETVKQFGYKQVGDFQKTWLDGKPAIRAQIEGISQVTGKSETVLITAALTGGGKLFYLMAIYPSSAEPADGRVFEEISNSVRLP